MRNMHFVLLALAPLMPLAVAAPVQAQLDGCQVGQRVAMPAGYQDKWLQAVIIEVKPSDTHPCRAHPLGYTPYADFSYKPSALRAPGSVPTQPIGGIADDPYLLAAQGRKAFKPSKVLAGDYECFGFSGTYKGGQLTPRVGLNFSILDGGRYRDVGNTVGSYRFDAATGALVFHGGGLDGQQAKYAQTSDPPARAQPPSITFAVSGDACDLRL
jgi:hypothetical protein